MKRLISPLKFEIYSLILWCLPCLFIVILNVLQWFFLPIFGLHLVYCIIISILLIFLMIGIYIFWNGKPYLRFLFMIYEVEDIGECNE